MGQGNYVILEDSEYNDGYTKWNFQIQDIHFNDELDDADDGDDDGQTQQLQNE